MAASKSWFTTFAQRASHYTGHPAAFIIAASAIVIWGISGPIFGFSDTWQLIINTSTTIITFLMVFIIQNTQNRDTGAIQIKLDELIRANARAKNALLDLEELDEKHLEQIRSDYERLAEEDREQSGESDEQAREPSDGRSTQKPKRKARRKPADSAKE